MSQDEINRDASDPRQELRRMSDSGRVSMGPEKPENYSVESARILLAVLELRTSNDRQFEAAFGKIDATNNRLGIVEGTMQEIKGQQVIANGSVGTLRAKVEILEKERIEIAKEATKEVIQSHVAAAKTEGVWIIPKPSWRAWTVIGGVLAFFGVDKIVHAIAFIGSMLAKLHP